MPLVEGFGGVHPVEDVAPCQPLEGVLQCWHQPRPREVDSHGQAGVKEKIYSV